MLRVGVVIFGLFVGISGCSPLINEYHKESPPEAMAFPNIGGEAKREGRPKVYSPQEIEQIKRDVRRAV